MPRPVSWERQLRRHRRLLDRCQHKATEKRVHALRVTARWLLAQLGPRGTATGRRERRQLKRLMRTTAPARDAQVQWRLFQRLTRDRRTADLEKFRRHLRRRARRLARKLTRTLAAHPRRFRLHRHVPPPPAIAARAAFRRTCGRLQRQLQSSRASGDPAALHRARAAVKQCHYLGEALGASRTRLAGLHRLQAILGELHDLDLFLARLETHAARHRRAARWLRRHRPALRGRRERLWRNLPRNPGRPW